MATQTAELGFNRTGIATSPLAAKEMVEGTSEFPPEAAPDDEVIGAVRGEFAREADPLGTVPPPMTLKGGVRSAVQGLKGARPTQLVDKLGERLAFERTGVRLYEALISKFLSLGGYPGGPELSDLENNLSEEYEHFRLLTDVITRAGGDPTVMTPSADLHATIGKGVLEVMVDPRTTLVQCLEALLVVELSDNECWDTLVDLAREAGDDDVVKSFEDALAEEAEHLEDVRSWIAAAQSREAAE